MHNKTLVFAGQFEIGEQITPLHKRISQDALKLSKEQNADLAILVGDIGVTQKIEAYIKFGFKGINAIYLNRISGAETGCAISQLPTVEKLPRVIDETTLKEGVDLLEAALPGITKTIKKGEYSESEKMKVSDVVRTIVCPKLVKLRVAEYSLNESIKIYSERQLKNKVSFKMREERANRKVSWLSMAEKLKKINPMAYLLFTEVQKNERIPSCRGIMLELYTEVAEQSYTTLVQLYPKTHELALKNAQGLFDVLHEAFPEDPRWQLNFKYKLYKESFF